MDPLETLNHCQAIIADSHVVYASGKHGSTYVNKDALYAFPELVEDLCLEIAIHFFDQHGCIPYEVVIGPEKGAIVLASRVGQISIDLVPLYTNKPNDIRTVFAEREYKTILSNSTDLPILIPSPARVFLDPGQKLIIDTGKFIIKRGYDKLITGKKVLIVEDILNTGGTVKKVVRAVRANGGEVVAVADIFNRGGVTAADIGDVPELFSLVEMTLDMWDEKNCPLCASGVPVNTSVGKGQEFLDKRK